MGNVNNLNVKKSSEVKCITHYFWSTWLSTCGERNTSRYSHQKRKCNTAPLKVYTGKGESYLFILEKVYPWKGVFSAVNLTGPDVSTLAIFDGC
jgi:hypothetical protein